MSGDLEWRGGVPASRRFDDPYYSLDDGLAESRAVFLGGCGLPEAWAGRTQFVIGELGFGTGLNLLAAWALWRRARPAGGRLHFVSVEAFPIRAAEAARAHAAWPELAALSERLTPAWPPPDPGAHFRRFDEDGVSLTVVQRQASEALPEMILAADAWFLDGFAPARNPDLWTPELMRSVAKASAPGARAASYSVAGAVRRALGEAGFIVEKQPGHAGKRERLEARLPGRRRKGGANPGRVAILGGGIAGRALADALAARGVEAAIVSLGPAASRPPRALLTPRLENADRPHARALLAAFHHAAARYRRFGYAPTGALRLSRDADDASRFEALAARWSGLEPRPGGLWMSDAGALEPDPILNALGAGAEWIEARVAAIERTEGAWRLVQEDGSTLLESETVALAAGAGAPRFSEAAELELELSAGQVGLHALQGGLDHPITGPAYLAPAGKGRVMLGATHDRWYDDAPPDPDPDRQRDLRETLAQGAPGVAARVGGEPLEIWTGVRCATRDRLPAAGRLQDGLFVLSGLGSRGFAHAPLLAELVAAEIAGDPLPLERSGRDALHPGRFAARRARRARS